MKISPKFLHIPPHLSSSWENIRTLFLKETVLHIQLKDGQEIRIPHLTSELLDLIFQAHAQFLEDQIHKEQSRQKDQTNSMRLVQPNNLPLFDPARSSSVETTASFQFAFGNIDSLNSALHHNPAQSNMPALPDEVLSKISAIAKIVAPEEIQNMPIPEQHCNCMHCQIARTIHQTLESNQLVAPSPKSFSEEKDLTEEEISDEDLKFEEWVISLHGDKLYSVVRKLDPEEKYQVYLGEPFGCTCGNARCEHLLAVLKS